MTWAEMQACAIDDAPGDLAELEWVRRYSWPNGEIWLVDYWSDGRVTREVVGNWITGEVWGRGNH